MSANLVAIGVEFGYLLSKFELSNIESSAISVPKPKARDVVKRLETVYQNIEILNLTDAFSDLKDWIARLHDEYGPFDEDDSYNPGGLVKSIRSKTVKAFRGRRSLNKEVQKDLQTQVVVWIDRLSQIDV